MREIGVRELKATLSEVLRRVAAGEPVRVTVHKRPIADILPVPAGDADERMRTLVAEGRLSPPSTPRPDRAPRLARGKRSASELVLAERETDR